MIGRHLHTISKHPDYACEIPTAPDFVTTFQCIGQWKITILTTLADSGFDTFGDLAIALSDFLGGEGGLLTAILNKNYVGT